MANDELGTTNEESLGFNFFAVPENVSQESVDRVLHGTGFSIVVVVVVGVVGVAVDDDDAVI